MTPLKKIGIGGLGALTPIVLNLLVVDLEAVWLKATVFAIVGYLLRVIALFYLGGIVSWLHKREESPIKLFELGLAAPALITAMINGAISKPQGFTLNELTVTAAYAGPSSDRVSPYSIRSVPPLESYGGQFLRGLTGSAPPTGGDLPPMTTVFSAAAPGGFALDTPGGGVFTEALVRGLAGVEADRDRDGNVSLAEIGAYIQASVNDFAMAKRIGPQAIALDSNTDLFRTSLVGSQGILRRSRAVVAGVGEYREFPSLSGSARGAREFAKLITGQGGHVTLLLNPTRRALVDALRRTQETIERDEVFVFYFGGQSVVGANGFGRLAASDSSPRDEASMLGLDELKTILTGIKSGQNVLFLDVCYGGLSGGRSQ